MSLTMIVVAVILAALLIFLIFVMFTLSEGVKEQLKKVHRRVGQTLDDHSKRLEGHNTRLEVLLEEFDELLRSRRLERLATIGDLHEEIRADRQTWQAAIQELRNEARAEARADREHFHRLIAKLAKKE